MLIQGPRFTHRLHAAMSADTDRTACRRRHHGHPTPGHTIGHVMNLVDDELLFTGDSLDFDLSTSIWRRGSSVLTRKCW